MKTNNDALTIVAERFKVKKREILKTSIFKKIN